MKVSIQNKKCNKKVERIYPYVGICGLEYVLFVKECTGTLLKCNDPSAIGMFVSDWDEELFIEFEGKLVLENDNE